MEAMSRETLYHCIQYVHGLFERKKIWHCLAYGTLLGAVRDGDIIEWDHDFDFFIRPEDLFSVLSLNHEIRKDGFRFRLRRHPGTYLAVSRNDTESFWNGSVSVEWNGVKVGDLYAFVTFSDGVLRRFDFDTDVYWCPHSSFPAYFIEKIETVILDGIPYPAFRSVEKWLEGVYGTDWETPYRAPIQGGEHRKDVTIYGDRFVPKLREEIAWCRDRGWNPGLYTGYPEWPRHIGGAGPKGPTPRTRENSGALWWRDINELIIYY